MKVTTLVLFVFCCVSKSCVFGQTLSEKDLYDREAVEIANIIECVKENRKLDSLIEWELSSKNDSLISFGYGDRLVFFKLHKDTKGVFLQAIDYYHNSFEKMIFSDNTLSKHEITDQTQFRVWMSKDRLSIYFCLINPNKPMVWVLTNGVTIYTP